LIYPLNYPKIYHKDACDIKKNVKHEQMKKLTYVLNILAVFILSGTAVLAKMMHAFTYTNLILFNFFDIIVYGCFSFLVGFLSRWKDYKFSIILIISFILPSLFFVGQILSRVYIEKKSTYPSYEWMASMLIILLSAFVGGLLSKRLMHRKQNA